MWKPSVPPSLRMKVLLGQRPVDAALPQLAPLRCRPSLERIAATVAEHFGQDAAAWAPGTRSDDAARAVAAYLTRRKFGYSFLP